ncbi:MAG TPA: hypothetical protein PKU94_06145 [Candidatus Hydrothermia bacterium]|nr:hypothetical protein [Candidatus Hydrothermia bacterium]
MTGNDDILYNLCIDRMKDLGVYDNPLYMERFKHEFETVKDKGFVDYLLIIYDIVKRARENGVMVGPGRGCLSPDTMVMTVSGFRPVKDVRIGEYVIGADGKPHMVTNKFRYMVDEELVASSTIYPKYFSVTFDHEVLAALDIPTFRKATITRLLDWVPAGTLIKDDVFISYPARVTLSLKDDEPVDLATYAPDECTVTGNVIRGVDYEVPRYVEVNEALGFILSLYLIYGVGSDDDSIRLSFPWLYRDEFISFAEPVFGESMIVVDIDDARVNVYIKNPPFKRFVEESGLIPGDDVFSHLDVLFDIGLSDSYIDGLYRGITSFDNLKFKGQMTFDVKDVNTALKVVFFFRLRGYPVTIMRQPRNRGGLSVTVNLIRGETDSYSMTDEYTIEKVEMSRVRKKGLFEVYDLHVDGAESYVTLSGIVHNSSGGSLLCYLLGITMVDPIKHSLLFERFISPSRKDNPDIDIDFQSTKRDIVLKDIESRYGDGCVGRIPALFRFGVKQIIKDVCRVFGAPVSKAESLTRKIPAQVSLEEALDLPAVKEFLNMNPEFERILRTLYGTIRHKSKHAAGVVITDTPISELLSCEMVRGDPCVCFDKDHIEELGFLKVDALGLSTLDVIDDTLKLIGEDVELPLEFDDDNVLRMFREGKTVGVFQFETPALTKLLKRIKPETFNELMDAVALVRPGPANSGMTQRYIEFDGTIEFPYEEYIDITKDTRGQIIYQEQIMELVVRVAGLDYDVAERIRKLVSKKIMEELINYRDIFISGAMENGVTEEHAIMMWDVIEKSGEYAFNKSHACAYTIISWWCMWLKCYYPLQFLTATMMHNEDMKYEASIELYDMGYEIVGPKINISGVTPVIYDNRIYLPYTDILGVGDKAAEAIISLGEVKSFEDFMDRRDPRRVNVGVVRKLIMAGVFDEYGRRDELYYSVTPDEEPMIWDDMDVRTREATLIDIPSPTPVIDMFTPPELSDVEVTRIHDLSFDADSDCVYLQGFVRKYTKKDDYMKMTIRDGTGEVDVYIYENTIRRTPFLRDVPVNIPVFVKASIFGDGGRVYGDIVARLDEDLDERLLRFVTGEWRYLTGSPRSYNGAVVDVVVSARYFTSRRGNRGCRLVFESNGELMYFGDEFEDIVAGDVLIFRVDSPPFIKIKEVL